MTKNIMNPPWAEYPDYEYGCLGWRMGSGEDYMDEFNAWFKSLPADEKDKYKEDNPLPESWSRYRLYGED